MKYPQPKRDFDVEKRNKQAQELYKKIQEKKKNSNNDTSLG